MIDSGKGHPVRQHGRRGAVLLAALLAVAPAASGQTAREVGDPIRLIPGAGPGRYAPPPPAAGVEPGRRGSGLSVGPRRIPSRYNVSSTKSPSCTSA